jgi:two-component system phosphate regulon sensor histidine kinase PhoR
VQGHAAALLEMDGLDASEEQARRYLAVISREAGHLGGLIEDLLILSRGDAVGLRFELRATDLGGALREVHAALAPMARRDRRIALTCEVGERVPLALVDPARLRQVLMNLVRNAITYTPEGGIVAMEAGPNGTDSVAVVVADTGIGIAPEDQPRIFDRAYRTGPSPSRTRGFGLGLAIVKDLVQAMDGTVSVQSEPGKGSRFVIVLRRA